MSKKRILFVTQEMKPYTELSEMSDLMRQLPQYAQENGYEIRILMPKFGTINERRHKLHEVVRLSGMNIIVNDEDFPLIIKVASLPGAKMQIYFLDNDEFFKRKMIFEDEEGIPFDDNDYRTVFFNKGIMETVRKFGWAPDIIHCHGPMTSLIPLFHKNVYQNDPIFEEAKIVYSMYNHPLGDSFTEKFLEIAAINDMDTKAMKPFAQKDKITLNCGAIEYSEGIIQGSESMNENVKNKIDGYKGVFLEYHSIEDQLAKTLDLYKELVGEEEEEA